MDSIITNIIEYIISWINLNGYRLWQLGAYFLIIYIVYVALSSSLQRLGDQPYVGVHLENVSRLFLRVIAIILSISAIFSVFELPASYFIGSSAFIGAVIGFGSSQTINNIASGFFVVFSRPFIVMDYVKIGDYEGQVEEITINYTKLYTPTFNMLQIPNVQVLNSRILNATHEEMIKDTFQFSFPHSIPLSNEEIMNKCIKPSFNEIETKYRECVVRSPEVYFDNSTSFARTYMIRLFIQRGKAKDLYIIKSELSNHIMNHWDLERRKLG